MIWLLKKFGFFAGLVLTLLGIIFVPANMLEIEEAFRVWGGFLTVSVREGLLSSLCAICLARLLYLDLRRGLNDSDWLPVRKKLRIGLKLLFNRDARIAEFKKFTSDAGVVAFRAGKLAENALNSVNWEPVSKLPPPPYEAAILDHPGGGPSLDSIYRSTLINKEFEICDRLREPSSYYPPYSAVWAESVETRLASARRQAYENLSGWPAIEEHRFFPSETARNKWRELRCEVDEANKLLQEMQTDLIKIQNAWPNALSEDLKSRIPFSLQ